MHFREWKYMNLIKIELKVVPKGPIYNIPALVWVRAWHQPGDKPLCDPMMAQFTYAYMHPSASCAWWIHKKPLFKSITTHSSLQIYSSLSQKGWIPSRSTSISPDCLKHWEEKKSDWSDGPIRLNKESSHGATARCRKINAVVWQAVVAKMGEIYLISGNKN